MSFDEFPRVDRYSENEDESNSEFRKHFSERNGFLHTKPEKDKGCDFLVELIHKGMSTNWRFPVQLKSIENPKFIEKETVISYSFEISRLRYMLESIPPVGLIILYWPKKNCLYYDYAEAIYNRLLERHDGNMAWKTKENVNIHIPVGNVVDRISLTRIHQEILTRHQNSQDRSPALYPKAVESNREPSSSSMPELAANPVELLKTTGLEMFYNNEIPTLSGLIDQTQIKVLREDSHLSLLAGITNWSMGNAVEASFWLGKSLSNPVITGEDRAHATWTKGYLDFYLGKISLQEYNQLMKTQHAQVPADDIGQRLKYELCITRNEIGLLGPTDLTAIFDVPNRCMLFNYRISTANLSTDARVGLYLENVTNLGAVLIKFDTFIRRRLVAENKNGKKIDHGLIAEVDGLVGKLTNEIEYTFAHLKPIARNFVHEISLAQCYESQVAIWLELRLNALLHPIKKFDFQAPELKRNITIYTSFAKEALQTFLDHHRYLNAYNMTLMLLEISEFAAHSAVKLDLDAEATSRQADWLQQKLEVAPRKGFAKTLIDAYKINGYSQL
ncbi:DUF4365 domain-containing protein [Chitinophaga filiformis]|uniref:DUF4365 domain-containing protein n=1 Tax=Chitinophaga filiformis TaxID=104663 RepID=A0ABY4I5N0_CHIFI|nr:DUF4365 domain-containing protein [Chitinophaga filiformis]UPK71391.1 DUF4365 domain-containing protein [Chitinophaga filiformis]